MKIINHDFSQKTIKTIVEFKSKELACLSLLADVLTGKSDRIKLNSLLKTKKYKRILAELSAIFEQ